MKVLFLDVDGVLNSRRSAVALGGYPFPEPGQEHKFDLVAVGLIKRICEAGVVIVLSSTWKGDKNHKALLFNLPIIGITPTLPGLRGEEIAAWLKDHPEVEKWAIVDDDPDMLPEQQEHFVHVSGIDGLLWQNYVTLCAILEVGI